MWQNPSDYENRGLKSSGSVGEGQREILFKILDGRYFVGYFGREEHMLHSVQFKTKYQVKEAKI